MKTILVVDDEPSIRALLQVTLENGEYTLLQAANGHEAVDLARRHRPDLMILDLMMPGELNGYDVCNRLKSEEGTRNIKILMLTARRDDDDREKGASAAPDRYFVKPFSPFELLRGVSEMLE